MAGPITWRSIAAPDATGAAQILQQAGQNIGRGIDAFKGIADNRVAEITDQNISNIAQQIIGAGEGYEGLNNLSALESSLQGIDAANVGGSAGLSRIMELASGRRTELEAQATDAFNDALVRARQTGDFSEVNQQKDMFGSLVRNSANTLETARSAEATFKANQLLQNINSGQVKPEDVLNNPDFNTQQPEYAAVFDAIAQRQQGTVAGQAMRLSQQLMPKIQTGEVSPSRAIDQINSLFKDDFELAKNSQLIGGLMNQFMEIDARAKNMTPEETLYFEQAKSAVNQQAELFKQQEEAVKNNIMRRFGADSAAITIRDQIRDSNLSLSAVIQSAYPDADDDDRKDIRQELEAVANKYNYSPEVIAYAIHTHPEINDPIWTNRKNLENVLKLAKNKMDVVNNAYAEFDMSMIEEKKRFIQYQLNATKSIIQQSNVMVNSRRQGTAFNGFNIPQFEISKDLISLMGSGVTVTGGNKPETGNNTVINNAAEIIRQQENSRVEQSRSTNRGGTFTQINSNEPSQISRMWENFRTKDREMTARQLEDIEKRRQVQLRRREQN